LQGSPLGFLSNGCYSEDQPGVAVAHGLLLEEHEIPEDELSEIGEEESQYLIRERRK